MDDGVLMQKKKKVDFSCLSPTTMGPCAVCLSELPSGAGMIRLVCGHAFCSKCLSRCAEHDMQRCPTCRRPHELSPTLLSERLATFRSGYQSWRTGGARGAKGEMADEISKVHHSWQPTTTTPRKRLTTSTFEEAVPPTKKEEPPVAKPPAALRRPLNVWVSKVVLAGPDALIAACLFLHAILAAAFRSASSWLLTLSFGVAMSVYFACPHGKQLVDKAVPKLVLRSMISHLYAVEFVGVWLIAAGQPCWLDNPGLALVGLLLVTQCFQVSRVQRKSTGAASVDNTHLGLLTIAAISHHLGSFVFLPDRTTALFVVVWRSISISTHSLELIDEYFKPPAAFFQAYGTFRYATCVFVFQPIAIFAVVFPASSPFFAALKAGLAANATGHASYLLFRALRLADTRFKRDHDQTAISNPLNATGREKPFLEIEIATLSILAAALLILPTTHNNLVAAPPCYYVN